MYLHISSSDRSPPSGVILVGHQHALKQFADRLSGNGYKYEVGRLCIILNPGEPVGGNKLSNQTVFGKLVVVSGEYSDSIVPVSNPLSWSGSVCGPVSFSPRVCMHSSMWSACFLVT